MERIERIFMHGNQFYRNSVATTWKVSFELLRHSNPSSILVLELLVFINTDEIQIEFLRAGAGALGDELQDLLSELAKLNDALISLATLSLIRLEARKIKIHRLVQAVVKDRINTE